MPCEFFDPQNNKEIAGANGPRNVRGSATLRGPLAPGYLWFVQCIIAGYSFPALNRK